MTELTTMIAERGQVKAKLTRIINFVKSFSDSDNISLLKARIPSLHAAFSAFDNIQSKIEIADEAAINSNERESIENKYYTVVANIEDIITKRESIINANDRTSSARSSTPAPDIQVKLPALNLPIFEGNYSEWMSFYDTFNSLIHENNTLNDCQKFHYLKSCVKGDAFHAIESLAINNANYTVAFDMLKTRYNNKRLIVQEHVCAMINSPAISKTSHTALRKLLNDITANTEALKVLNIPVASWDAILVPLITEKLDYNTKRDWQDTLNSDVPTFSSLKHFLEHKCQLLESLSQTNSKQTSNISSNLGKQNNQYFNNKQTGNNYNKIRTTTHVTTNKAVCHFCNLNSHSLFSCPQFLALSINERIKFAKRTKLCLNCLKDNHFVQDCKSPNVCRECKQKHNTLLHLLPVQLQSEESSSKSVNTYCSNKTKYSSVLLSTAIIKIKNNMGKYIECRALLDVGSQSNIITIELCKKLNLNTQSISIPISGINCSSNNVNKRAQVEIKSRTSNFATNIDCLVLDKITENLPIKSFNTSGIHIPSKIQLADPNFNKQGPIDILLGADIFWDILGTEKVNCANGQPHFQETKFGWIVGGSINVSNNYSRICNLTVLNSQSLQQQVAKLFWEIEEPTNISNYSVEENACESHFKETVKRNKYGRFIVNLPFKPNTSPLGQSREIALKRFYALENKLNKQPQLKVEYSQFINEYLNLGHMTEIRDSNKGNGFYLPHHAVVKSSSLTTRLRVVFDGSCKTSNGVSLNEILMVGPNIQQDLFSIIIRFRTYQYVFTADIAKMYRQILLENEQREFQKILWREDSSQPIKTYQRKTVTYGTASASWLAIRTLHELAEQERDKFPLAYSVIKNDFYVDDLLSGCNTIQEGIEIRDQLITTMQSGNFELRKWASNCSLLLPNLSELADHHEITMFNLDREHEFKLLGLLWDSKNDLLKYSSVPIENPTKFTKRHVLSVIARIFDPLGLISPVLIKAKILLQHLWLEKISWDDPIPLHIEENWLKLINEFHKLDSIKIPRKVLITYPLKNIELHAFCDASQEAYGAVIYLRCTDEAGNHSLQLLCAKSRVAPIKTISIPRLELCGALLLARLVDKVSKALNLKISNRYLWTDSSILLSWLSEPANKWQTFVANRISEIQQFTNINEWNHINSQYNPADIISRGAFPEILSTLNLWWNPDWLQADKQFWPKSNIELNDKEIPEIRKSVVTITAVVKIELPVLQKFSCFSKLQRVIAYVLRFINICKNKLNGPKNQNLTYKELNAATNCIIKLIQANEFAAELKALRKDNYVHKQSNLFSLNPFLDSEGLIRVGGRIKNANISHDRKFPIVLPAKHHVTKLLIIQAHERQLHAGTQATLCSLRETFWPIHGRNTVRRLLHKCMKCFRARPCHQTKIMSDLPSLRLTPTRPFSVCGVDYAGPLLIKQGRGRGQKSVKVYVAVFVCFAVKAIHLELVGDYTTESFLGALKRFMARRGKVTRIYSDNATNFTGANKELKSLVNLFHSSEFDSKVINHLSDLNIEWSFIPARSPHRGGLWEAGVKSVKYHLQRTIGNTQLTYEELYTLLTQIEACLNSRPITPLSTDPNDLYPLTPSHFLIGDVIRSNVEPDLTDIKINRLSRWQHIQQMQQHFWRRWSKEYLSTLQQRTKWQTDNNNPPEVGDAVLLIEDNLPPLTWRMGRITAIHPGKDDIIRTVSVKTNNGVVLRAVNKICVLPISEV